MEPGIVGGIICVGVILFGLIGSWCLVRQVRNRHLAEDMDTASTCA